MTVLATTPTHHLISDTGTLYQFAPGADGVAVVVQNARHRSRYVLDVDEARQLWRTLRLRGYRPW